MRTPSLLPRTDPLDPDMDGDGLPDGWEVRWGLDPFDDGDGASADSDLDGLSNGEEMRLGTDPLSGDTDGDGLDDRTEVGWVELGATLPAFDLSEGTNLYDAATAAVDCDDERFTVPLPFAVRLGGIRSTNATICANGVVGFLTAGKEQSVFSVSYGNDDLAEEYTVMSRDHSAVAAYWDDLYVRCGTDARICAAVAMVGTSRWFVVEYAGVTTYDARWQPDPPRATFQVAVSESDPCTAHVRYVSLGSSFDGSSATIGAQGPDRSRNFPVAYEIPGGVTNGMVLSYHFGIGSDPCISDTDGDGLRDDEELVIGTDPTQPDTDGDGMDDAWEHRHGFDPMAHNSETARTDDDADADPDGDGLTNAEECEWGTNPSGADTDGDGVPDGRDTDGDGVPDGAEVAQNSDPNDASDEGLPNSRSPVRFTFGDPSGSHSEKYRLEITPVSPRIGDTPRGFAWLNANYGECETKKAMLKPGWKYEIRLFHSGTDPRYNGSPRPDYDYRLRPVTDDLPGNVAFDDPEGLFGDSWASSTFAGEGKVATVYVLAPPEITAPKVIGVNNDDDNGNGTPDRQDNGEVAGDDDLVEVTVSARCPAGMTGTLTVRPLVDINKVNIWKDRARTELDMFARTYPVSGPEGVTQTFYVEGDAYSASYMCERIQATLACGGATSTNEHRFTVVERIAEPITTEREGGQIVNPCCAVIGASTPMKVQVLPSDFPDGEIKWKVASGSGSFANGGTGRNVSFTATGPENSTTKLQVDVGDCPGRAPQFTLSATAMHEVNIYPCIIHAPDEESIITIADIELMVNYVNTIYRQVGLHFSLAAQIMEQTNELWAANGLIDTSVGATIRNLMSGTGGLEVYFIPGTGLSDEPRGSYTPQGIIIRNSANAITLAHEIGHACGWHDICRGTGGGINADLINGVRQAWMPYDWNNGTGCRFYDPLLLQSDLIPRLLMYEYGSDSKCDIPAGWIYGLTKSGEIGMIGVGKSTFMTFTPSSL